MQYYEYLQPERFVGMSLMQEDFVPIQAMVRGQRWTIDSKTAVDGTVKELTGTGLVLGTVSHAEWQDVQVIPDGH